MNRIQKMSWFTVVCFFAALVISLIAAGVLSVKFGLPRGFLGFCFMGLMGICGLGPVLFKKDKDTVISDERDRAIHAKSSWVGFGASYLVMGVACMVPFFVFGPEKMVRVTWLPNIFMLGGMTFYLVYSVAILMQYGKGEQNNE